MARTASPVAMMVCASMLTAVACTDDSMNTANPSPVVDAMTPSPALDQGTGQTDGQQAEPDTMVEPPIETIAFDRSSGTFAEAFELTIARLDGAQVFYTTDGSPPPMEPDRYTESLCIVF